jgi:general secretion pathway protein A
MYQTYFNLVEMPFKITPDPRFLYMTPQHREAIGKCEYNIKERGGLVVIYGAIGMGKTTIARHLYDSLRDEPNYKVAQLITPALKTETAFLRAIMEEFDAPLKRSYALSLSGFQDYILEAKEKGQNLVLIVDEAQKLNMRMLDVLHTLLNFESNTEKFLQIVLIGQLELAGIIDRIPAIKSRVAAFAPLENLNSDDTNEMIAFRWNIASNGKSSHPFNDKALEAIFQLSNGLPREINKLCNESLLSAYDAQEKAIDANMVIDAAKELRLSSKEIA